MQVGSHHFTGSASEGFGIYGMKLRGNVFWTYLQGFGTLFDFGHLVTKLMGAEGGKMVLLEEL